MWPTLRAKWAYSLAALSVSAASSGAVFGQVPARVEVDRLGETVRLNIILPESEGGDLAAQAELAANFVIVAELSDAIEAELSTIRQDASDYIAMARLDPDGETLRLALNRDLEPRVSVSHNIIALDLAPPGSPAQPDVVSPFERDQIAQAEALVTLAQTADEPERLPPLPVDVQLGETGEYTRIGFNWPQSVTYALENEENRAVLRFSRDATIDLAPLSVNPPRFVDSVTQLDDGEGLSVAFNLAPNTTARVFTDAPGRIIMALADANQLGTQSVLDALEAYAQSQLPDESSSSDDDVQAAGPDSETPNEVDIAYVEPERENPIPESGVVAVEARRSNNDLTLNFPWAALPGVAVFRRAEALWIVFDAGADLDISEIHVAGSRHVGRAQAFSGPDFAALRITAAASTQADVRGLGSNWVVTLTESIDEPPLPVRLARDTGFNRPAVMRIGMNNARGARYIPDPVVGDHLWVVTADGEKRGIITPRRYAESQILPSSHGVAIEPFVDDLEVVRQAGGAIVTRPGGLELSRTANPSIAQSVDRPVTPGFLDLERWRGDQTFLEGLHRLQLAALELEPEPLMALARFSIAWGLATEAIGYLNLAVDQNPALEPAPETAALRGVAQLMAGRMDEANASLGHSGLINDPAAQSWRALIAVHEQDWPLARRRFEAGRDSVFFFDPEWRTRLTAYHALSALMTNDLGAVQSLLDEVKAGVPDPEAQAIAGYAKAGLDARTGDLETALARYDELTLDEWRPIRARAQLSKVVLQTENDLIEADQAVEALESLRFQWRGDDTEVAAAAMLGRVYANAGRYDEALQIMESTQLRFPESPVADQLNLEMNALFRMLFLDGGADRMDPLSAVALWREYQGLTPSGPDGVRMVMNMVARLVEIDLLDQAANYLQYWVDERSVTMTAQARAQIARDLAEIYLLDDRPEMALRAIDSTRIARLPQTLVGERRLLQARALSSLGRTEHALELIANDDSSGAERLRAQIAWDGELWDQAGRRLEALLGNAWRDGALDRPQTHDVMRAIISYALAGDRAGIDRLKARYGAIMAQTNHAAAFSLIANETVSVGDARIASLVGELASFEPSENLLRGFQPAPEETG